MAYSKYVHMQASRHNQKKEMKGTYTRPNFVATTMLSAPIISQPARDTNEKEKIIFF